MTDAGHSPRRDALAPALVLCSIMIAHTILETARDALFLARLGPDRLAWVYLAMAGFALAAFAVLRRWTGLRDPRRVLFAFLIVATAGTAWFALNGTRGSAIVFAFYVWTGLTATLIIPSFWTVLDRSLRVGQAKQLFATIGAGGVIGAMVGSAVAGVLGRLLDAHDLVAAGAAAYAVATLCTVALAPRGALDEPRSRPHRAETLSRGARRYVALLIGFGVVSMIALTLGDLLFKRVVAQRLVAADLASAFGAIYTGLNALALAIQLLITRRLLAKWGVGGALLVLPVIVAAMGFGYALTGTILTVIVLKLGDGGLRHSLHRVSSELLYLPVPAAVRDGWKPVADALVLRGGEALAALAAFALGASGSNARMVAAVTTVTALVWLFGVPIVHRAYLGQFRDMLRAGEIERDARVPTVDGDTVSLLIESLASPDPLEALAALDLLAGRARVPALVLYHPCASVVYRALSVLEHESRSDVERALGHLLDHEDIGIRAAALAATAGSDTHRARRIAALADPDPRVRAAALVGLVGDPEHGDTAAAAIAGMVTRSTEDRAALAQAIAHAPDRRLRDVLYELLAWREPGVVRDVVRVLAREPGLADLDRLLGLLAQPQARSEVRNMFVAAGARGLERLLVALEDPRTPLAVRQHLPRTISRFGSRRAAAALVGRLARESDSTTVHKLLRALGRMRTADPALRIDQAAVRDYARRTVAVAARYATLGDALRAAASGATAASALLAELVREEYDEAIEHVFRALGILRPRAGLRSVHDAMSADDDARRSAAREILDAQVPAELRAPLLALLEHCSPDDRRTRLGPLAAGPFASYEQLVAALLTDPSESVRCIAAYHVAEHHLVAIRPELVRLRASASPPLVHHAFEQAIGRLDAGS
jgi:hypothetical protein